MAQTIEELVAKLSADVTDFQKGFNDATNISNKFSKRLSSSLAKARGSVNKLGGAVFSLKGALIGLGVGAVARSFLDAGKTTEEFRIRLDALTGSAASGNQVFQDASKFAAGVAFEYKDILGAATQLSGVVKGGPEEIKGLLPIIADLATVSGLSITDTTGQVQRMLSAGAASADMFRERGINAMLGFQAGVTVSAAETKRRLIEAFEDPESKFRGASANMAKTWSGMTSMVADKWFQFRDAVMGAGLFDFLKGLVSQFDTELGDAINDNGESARKWAATIVDGIGTASGVIGIFADGIHGIGIIIDLLKAGFQGFTIFVSEIFTGLAIVAENTINSIVDGWNKSLEGSPRIAEALGLEELSQVDFVSGLVADVETTKSALKETLADIESSLTEELPSTAIERRMETARASMVAAQEEAAKTAAAFKIVAPEEEGLALPSGGTLGVAKTDQGEATGDFKTDLQERLVALRESNMTELEVLQEKFDSERLMLESALENKLIDEESFMEEREQLEQSHQNTLFDIELDRMKKQADKESAFNKLRLSVAEGLFSNLSTLMDSSSRSQFRVGKMASRATVIIKGIESVQSAYAAGNATGVPGAGAVFAASAAIASAQQLSKINSASFGGGGSISAPGGTAPGGGAGTVPPGVPSEGILARDTEQQAQRAQQIVVNVNGNIFNSEDTADIMAELLSEAVEGRGVRLVTSGVV